MIQIFHALQRIYKKGLSHMKKNILKCITTIMLALTLCTTITHDTLPLQNTTTLEIIEPLSGPFTDAPKPRD